MVYSLYITLNLILLATIAMPPKTSHSELLRLYK